MKKALIVVDIQNYFIADRINDLPKKIAKLIVSKEFDFDYILFSKFINCPDSNFYKLLNWKECEQSPDIDIHPDVIQFVKDDNVFDKSTFSVFKSKMKDFIDKHGISKLYICGVDIESCVLSSAYEGFDLGYDIEVLVDYCLSNSGSDMTKLTKRIIKNNLTKSN